jgi:hypothetical protein
MQCNACPNPYHPATGHRLGPNTVLCGICARDFIKWIKAREANMGRPWRGANCSFTEAALTSIVPGRTDHN